MQGNTAIAGTADAVSPPALQQGSTVFQKYTDEQVRQIEVSLEYPFAPTEIKWRVTNTTADRRRGQVIAYADPRAYTDRLNELFTVRGWTREYSVQVIQNFERRERANEGSTISGKIVVTCKLTIDGLGSHSGLGEEWADNENAGTSAEAQAFKRACSCFGLGRYLYDLDGIWVDLDERRQPVSKPRLPEWALPKRKPAGGTNAHGEANRNGCGQNGVAPADVTTLKARAKSLCEQVGLGLARSATKMIAATESPDRISDPAVLKALLAKLEDTLRGVERLRAATAVAGPTSFSQLCQQMNLAGDGLDDVPDRRTLRQLIEALENGADTASRQNGSGRSAHALRNGHDAAYGANGHGNERPSTSATRPTREEIKLLGATRGDLIREAQRVAKLRGIKVSAVVDRAAKGAFRFTNLQRLTLDDLPALKAAVEILRQVG
jgi:hypothetical protein